MTDIKYHDVSRLKQRDLSVNVKTQAVTVTQVSSFADQSNQNPQSKEYEELKEELKLLMEEIKRLEKEAKEKILKEILPFIKRELEKLRKRLREFRLEDDKSEPKKIPMEQPRKKRTYIPL